jgi:predicted dehydrogenase
MSAKKLKVGIIGVGGIASAHLPGWKDGPHTEIVAGSDLNSEILSKWGTEHGVKKLYSSPIELISDPEIDIVDVCTPSGYHAELSIAALKAGKHVLCEKPLAPTPDEIRKMIAARDKSRKLLMTAQHFRFQESARALKAEISGGVLGDVYHARSWMLRRAALPTRLSFLQKKHSGGGPCIDIGVHILDLTLWMMGHPKPISVTGVARKELAGQPGAFSIWGGKEPLIPKEMDVEDFSAAFVRFENGATLMLEVSWMLHHETPKNSAEDMQVWLYGTQAGTHWPSCKILTSNNATQQHLDTQLLRIEGKVKPHAAECMALAQAIVDGAPSPVPPEESLIVQTILDGLYRSQIEGSEVKLSV